MNGRVSALFIELEGVIAHTLPYRAEALCRALAAHGIDVSFSEATRAAAGRAPADAIAGMDPVTAGLDRTDQSIISMQAERAFSSLLAGGMVLAPGAPEFVRTAGARVPLAIVTRARRADADLILELSALNDAFTVMVCAEDAVVPKPDPSAYRAAVERMRRRGVTPDGIVALEDGGIGIDSARGAGLRCVAVGPLPGDEAFRADAWIPELSGESVHSIGDVLHGQTRRVQ